MKEWSAGEKLNASDLNANFAEAAFKLFGNGADGDVVVSVNGSLARDMYYKNLTINDGITLNPNGYRIFVSGILTYVGTGKIARNGNNGSNGGTAAVIQNPSGNRAAGGAALADGTIKGAPAGGYGGSGAYAGSYGSDGETGEAGGAANPSITNVSGVAGGTGGGGGSGGGKAGGIAGVATAETLSFSTSAMYLLNTQTLNAENLASIYSKILLAGSSSSTLLSGSAASGGGGGGSCSGAWFSGGGSGGGAGGNGGVVYIAAFSIVTVNGNTFAQAKGGNGGNGGNGSGISNGLRGSGGGGGSGGQGGLVILIYHSLTGAGVIDVSGGTKGLKGTSEAGATLPTDGNDGNAGKYIKIKIV